MTKDLDAGAAYGIASGNAAPKKKRCERVIPAYIIEAPDLALHTSILNLLWYSVECINGLPGITGGNARNSEHFIRCIVQLRSLVENSGADLDDRVRKELSQFLDEGDKTAVVLRDFLTQVKGTAVPDDRLLPQSAWGQIAAKATYLQWLVVCIAQDLRLPSGADDAPDALRK